MEIFSIGTDNEQDRAAVYTRFRARGLLVLHEERQQHRALLEVGAPTGREPLSEVLATWIVEQYGSRLMQQAIRRHYYYFNEGEQQEILRQAIALYQESPGVVHGLYRRVYEAVDAYLAQDSTLLLPGFVTFRLGEVRRELETTVDEAVDAYIIQREYEEFVQLLRYFVELQPCKVPLVRVFAQEDGSYLLQDREGAAIPPEEDDDFLSEFSLQPDDWLLSRLITLSPRRLELYHGERIQNKEFLHTLLRVFPTAMAEDYR